MQNVTMLSQYATIVSGVQQPQHLTVTDINNRQRGNQVKSETSLENDVFFQNAPKPGTMQPLIVDETRQYMEGLMDQDDDSDGEKGDKSDGSKRSGNKKTRGRVKIKMEFIQNKLRRYTTFSKRKTGIMKKVKLFLKRLRSWQIVFITKNVMPLQKRWPVFLVFIQTLATEPFRMMICEN